MKLNLEFRVSPAIMLLALVFTIGACTPSIPLNPSAQSSVAEPQISFVDIGKFDKDLATSLSSDLAEVNVSFYTKVSPNKIPDRMQQWISAVENSGGKVRVEHPPNEPAPRSILPLLSLLGTAYSALKDRLAAQPDIHLNAAKGRNVVIALERSPNGDLLVNRIQFTK
jgi:hypothetical protein